MLDKLALPGTPTIPGPLSRLISVQPTPWFTPYVLAQWPTYANIFQEGCGKLSLHTSNLMPLKSFLSILLQRKLALNTLIGLTGLYEVQLPAGGFAKQCFCR